jgi:Fur family peroxide stress response transcriptional regulator
MISIDMERAAAFKALEEKCRKRGLPVTIQRRAVLEEILGRKDHPTADQVLEALSHRHGGVSRATVYRALDTLVELGFVRRMAHADAVARFDPVTDRHHHLVCDRCGKVLDLSDDSVGRIVMPKSPPGFSVRDYTVYFTGICSSCRTS